MVLRFKTATINSFGKFLRVHFHVNRKHNLLLKIDFCLPVYCDFTVDLLIYDRVKFVTRLKKNEILRKTEKR